MPDLPPGAANDFNAIFVGANKDNGAGTVGRAIAEELTAEEEVDLFIPGDESLAGRPTTEDDRTDDEGDASRRPPASGGFPAADPAAAAAAPPVDARLDLGGGSKLLPAKEGFDGAFVVAAAVDDVVAPEVDGAALDSRRPSAVFFLECGACIERR